MRDNKNMKYWNSFTNLRICVILIFLITTSNITYAETKGEILSNAFKSLIEPNSDLISRKYLTQYFKDNNYLCYNQNDKGQCSHVELPTIFTKNGVVFYVGNVIDGYVDVEKIGMIWDGDKLCYEKGYRSLRSWYLSDKPSNVINYDLKGFTRVESKLLEEANKEIQIEMGEYKYCYGYKLIGKTQGEIIQVEYIDGELQKPKDFMRVSIIKIPTGSIPLQYSKIEVNNKNVKEQLSSTVNKLKIIQTNIRNVTPKVRQIAVIIHNTGGDADFNIAISTKKLTTLNRDGNADLRKTPLFCQQRSFLSKGERREIKYDCELPEYMKLFNVLIY